MASPNRSVDDASASSPSPLSTPALPARTSSNAVTEHSLESQAATPPPSAPPSAASSLKPRNRRGILSRQHSVQNGSPVLGSPSTPSNNNSPSLSPSSSRSRLVDASEDDEAAASDSAPYPRRFASSSTSKSHTALNPSSSLEDIVRFNKASPLASTASSLSGAESPAASGFHHPNRPGLPQSFKDGSKSSNYPPSSSKRYVSNSSRSSVYSADASDANLQSNDSMSHLSRAKSISSVSSVTSTSSMEAAPFRAAPMGNIRMSYRGPQAIGQRNTFTPAMLPSAHGLGVPQRVSSQGVHDSILPRPVLDHNQPSSDSNDQSMDDFVQAANAAAAAAATAAAAEASSSPQQTRSKGHNPKIASDSWQYRNAPGTGARLEGRPLPGSSRNLAELRQSAANHMQSRGVAPPDIPLTAPRALYVPDANSSPTRDSPALLVPLVSAKRPAQALRSKLAKSASKLGLKPLTVVPGATTPHPRIAAELADSASTTSEDLDVEQDLISSATGAALLDPRRAVRNGTNTSHAINAGFRTPVPHTGLDFTSRQRTSSITNAPLIVPKLSPALDGPAGVSAGGFGHFPSPLLTPTRMQDTSNAADLTGQAYPANLPSLVIPQASFASPRLRPSSLRAGASERDLRAGKGKHASLSPPSTPQAAVLGFSWPNGSPTYPSTHSPSHRSQLPSPSPAELVRMEAQAGMATLPTEGSGATPGPTPTVCADDASIPIASLPSQQISPTKKRGSGEEGSLTSSLANLLPRRPGFRRSRTNESMRSQSSLNKDKAAQAGLAKPQSNQAITSATEPTDADCAALQTYSLTQSMPPPKEPATVKSRPQSGASFGTDNLPLGAEAPTLAQSASSELPSKPARVSQLQDSPAGRSSQPPRFPPFPMQRMESAATAVSKAVSDKSDFAPPAPFKAPPREVAGKVNALDVGFKQGEGLDSTGALVSDSRSSHDLQSNAQNPLEGKRQTPASPAVEAVGNTDRAAQGSSAGQAMGSATKTEANAPGGANRLSQTVTSAAGSDAQANRPSAKPRGKDDFEFGDILGEGSYSTVILAWDLLSNPAATADSGPVKPTVTSAAAMAGGETQTDPWIRQNMKAYAIKVLDKIHILKERKQKYVGVEKEALSLLIRQPGVITLYWTFQDAESLYFVLELAENGELLTYIKRFGSFDEKTTRYYAAQLCETIAGMHRAGVIHRDIKPENILLNSSMRIKVTDFGSAKIVPSKAKQAAAAQSGDEAKAKMLKEKDQRERERASSFVGTAEYVSPELLTDKAASEASDFWAFGCVVFQMLTGRPPFKGNSEYQTFQKIIKRDLDFPSGLSATARDLIDSLLVLDPTKRLGSGPSGVDEIKAHPFFEGVEWDDRLWKMEAPAIASGIQPPPPKREEAPQASDASYMRDVFGTDNLIADNEDLSEGEMAEEGDREEAPSGYVQFPVSRSGPEDSSEEEESEDASPPPSVQSGHADADDDASSLSDSPHPPRRRGFSAGAGASERMGPPKRASALFRIAASVTGQDKSASIGRNRGHRGNASAGSTSSRGSVLPSQQQGSSTTSGSPSTRAFQPTANGMYLNWAALLLPHEGILFASPVIHRKTGTANLQSKRRMLILTDFPRLLCVKEDTSSLKVKSETLLALPRTGGAGGAPATAQAANMTRGQSWGGLAERQSDNTTAAASSTTMSPPQLLGSSDISGVASAGGLLPGRHTRRDSVPVLSGGSGGLSGGGDSSQQQQQQHQQQQLLHSPNVMMEVEQKTTRTFVVHTPARGFLYEDPSGDASHWVRSIRSAVQKAATAAAAAGAASNSSNSGSGGGGAGGGGSS